MDNQSQASIIADLNRENAQLKDEVAIFKKHIKESRELTDKDLIASLRHDLNVRNQQLLKAGRENKTLTDRNEYLEGAHKTAKAEGIREAITDLIQLTDDDFLLLDGYADQLEADNGKPG